MKEIALTKGKKVIVDDDVFAEINKYSWYYNSNGYAARRETLSRGVSKNVKMHHKIIGKPSKGFVVDHINRNKLDNRRSNLRFCSKSVNALNSKNNRKNNTSGFIGVSYDRSRRKWSASITINYKKIHLGRFHYKKDAVKARREANKLYRITDKII